VIYLPKVHSRRNIKLELTGKLNSDTLEIKFKEYPSTDQKVNA